MDNALIIDLVLAAVLAVFALLGARKGLIRSLMALVSVVVALIGATLLTAMFVEPVTDLVYPKVEERVLEQFERDIPSDALAAEDGDLSAGGLLPDELSDLLGEALDTLKRFGVSDDAIDGVTKSVTDSAVSAAERAAYLLVKTIVQAALFLAFFLALMLLLRLLTHGLDRLFSLPVLAQLNGLGGAALLDGVRDLAGHVRRRCTLAAGVGEDVEHRKAAGPQKVQRLAEFLLRFAGEADNQVCRHRAAGESIVQQTHAFIISHGVIFSMHPF